jgi:hypothetical protein
MAILDPIGNVLRFFTRKNKKPIEPRVIEHRGMKGYFSVEMIEEFQKAKVDYEKAFRESVDEILDDEEQDEYNPYR